MRANYLSDVAKKAIVDIARSLKTRASIETPPPPVESSRGRKAGADSVSELSDRIDRLMRHTNARLATLTVSIDYLHKKTAAISGQFDAVRQSLAEIQSTFHDERREASEATTLFIDQLSREVSSGLDGISSVVDATAEAQSQLIMLARQIAEGVRGESSSIDGHVS